MRVLEAQLTLAARAIGSLFMPALQAILPPAIAVVQVITELINVLASFVGFEMPKISWGDSSDLSNVSGELDNVASGAAAAKKEINYLIGGFDELNVMNKDTGSSGGGGSQLGNLLDGIELPQYDMFKDYVGNQVDEFVDKFRNAAKKITNFLKPITPILKGIGTAVATAFVAKKVSDFFKQFKTGNKLLSVASTAFDSIFHAFKTGSTATEKIANGFKAIWGNFSGFMQSLSPITKAVVSVAALGAEFITITDSVKQFELGNISLASALGQSTIAFGAATTVMVAMFGPIGALITAFTALVAVMKGLDNAQAELDKKVLESELYNNGGIKIEALVNNYKTLTDQVSYSSSALSTSFEEWDSNNEKIDAMALNISNLESQLAASGGEMANTLLPQISDAWGEMTSAVIENIKLQETTLIEWAKINSSYLNEAGSSYSEFAGTVEETSIAAQENITNLSSSIQDLQAKLSTDPGDALISDELLAKVQEFEQLTGISITTVTDLENKLSLKNIDFQSADQVKTSLSDIDTQTKNTIESLRREEESITNMWVTMAQQAGAAASDIELLKSTFAAVFDIKEAEVWESRDTLINQIVEGYKAAVADAAAQLEPSVQDKLSANGLVAAGLAATYDEGLQMAMAGRVSDMVDNSVTEAINQSDANTKALWEEFGSQSVDEYLKGVKGVDITKSTHEIGKDLVLGITGGMQEYAPAGSATFADDFIAEMKDLFGIHSPSTVMNEQVGVYLGQGIIEGMKQSLSILPTEIAAILNNLVENTVKPQFAIDKWTTIFNNVNVAANQKTTEAINEWKTSVQNWINKDVKSTFEEKVWSEYYEGMKTAFQKINEENLKDFNEFSKNLTNGVKNLISDLQDYADRHPIIIEIKTVRTGSSYGDSDDGEYSSRSRSRSVPALASGGVISSPSLVLTGEYNGVRNNPEIVSPQNIMRDTMEEANTGVISALYQLISIAEEIANKDTTIQLDGDEVGRSLDRRSRNKGFDLGVEY